MEKKMEKKEKKTPCTVWRPWHYMETHCIICCNSKKSSAAGLWTAQGNFSLGAEYINCKLFSFNRFNVSFNFKKIFLYGCEENLLH